MFDIGFSELVLIALVALIVLGPQRLPEVARTAGRWAGQARRFMDAVKSDFEREMTSPELEQFRKLQQDMAETRSLIEAPVQTLIEPEKPAQQESAAAEAPPLSPAVQEPIIPSPAIQKPAAESSAPAEAPTKPTPKPRTRRAPSSSAAARPKSTRKKHGGTTKRTDG